MKLLGLGIRFVFILFMASPAIAKDVIAVTSVCLDGPLQTNAKFNQCLKPLDELVESSWSDRDALNEIAASIEPLSFKFTSRIRNFHGEQKSQRLLSQLNEEGWDYFTSCMLYQITRENVEDQLAIARCNVDAQFFILHFYFDSSPQQWRDDPS